MHTHGRVCQDVPVLASFPGLKWRRRKDLGSAICASYTDRNEHIYHGRVLVMPLVSHEEVLRRFLGMVNKLGIFSPQIFERTQPLRDIGGGRHLRLGEHR